MKRLFVIFVILICTICRGENFNLNWYVDGNTYAQTTCTTGGDINLPAAPIKRGYTFNGWKYYITIEYLESTGTQYINTGVIFNGPNAEVVLKFAPVNNVNHNGAYAFAGSGWTFTASNCKSEKIGFYHGSINCSARTDLQVNISANTIYVIDATQENGVFSFNINGIINSASTTIQYSKYPYILFGTALSSTSFSERSQMKLYYAKIYDNGILIRDFIPVLDQDGVPCLFDKVEEKFDKASMISDTIDYSVGDKVEHDTYGVGMIVSMDKSIVTIAFPHPIGIKKMIKGHKSIRKV